MPLPRFIVNELSAHLNWHGRADEDLAFSAADGGPVRLATWRRRFWAPAVTAADVAPLRPHDLRHTAVSLWIAAGADAKQVAERAGHTSVAVVLERYGHLYPDSSVRLNEALDTMARAAAELRDATVVSLETPAG